MVDFGSYSLASLALFGLNLKLHKYHSKPGHGRNIVRIEFLIVAKKMVVCVRSNKQYNQTSCLQNADCLAVKTLRACTFMHNSCREPRKSICQAEKQFEYVWPPCEDILAYLQWSCAHGHWTHLCLAGVLAYQLSFGYMICSPTIQGMLHPVRIRKKLTGTLPVTLLLDDCVKFGSKELSMALVRLVVIFSARLSSSGFIIPACIFITKPSITIAAG